MPAKVSDNSPAKVAKGGMAAVIRIRGEECITKRRIGVKATFAMGERIAISPYDSQIAGRAKTTGIIPKQRADKSFKKYFVTGGVRSESRSLKNLLDADEVDTIP